MSEISVSTEKEGLGFNLKVSRSQAQWTFSLQIKNLQPRVYTMAFRSAKLVDFAVEKNGHPIWVWSAGQMFSQAIIDKKLRQNDTLGPYTAHWSGETLDGTPVDKGQYQLKAYFLGLSKTNPVVETIITV